MKGCEVLKDAYPDAFKECVEFRDFYWENLIPLALRKEVEPEDVKKLGEDYCEKRKRESEDFTGEQYARCLEGVGALYRTLRVVLFDKDGEKCQKLESRSHGEFCNAVFAGPRDVEPFRAR